MTRTTPRTRVLSSEQSGGWGLGQAGGRRRQGPGRRQSRGQPSKSKLGFPEAESDEGGRCVAGFVLELSVRFA